MNNEIVVGLDDSPSSKAALNWAAEQAKRLGAVLRAVHVLDWPYGLSSVGFPAPVNSMDVSHKELKESYRKAITAVFDAVSPRPDWNRRIKAEAPGRPLVVAGLDASAESLAAAHYAVTAAELRGSDILLVHAFPPPSARAPDADAAFSAARTTAEKLLAAMAAQLIVPPQVHVYGRAELDDAVTVLEGSARQAAMLVLGRDDVSWFERLFMGAVTSQVVGHVACPVVVVPGNWRARHASPRLPVIVALDGETAPEPALKLAFDEARLRDTRVIVLHAQPMTASPCDLTAARLDLEVVLAEWERDHPEVAISTAIVSGDPDAQLIRWSRSAGVLVVGHPHQRRWGSWTRSVARSVMNQTHCPLIVAPQATPSPDDILRWQSRP